jgi:hypothetical protein
VALFFVSFNAWNLKTDLKSHAIKNGLLNRGFPALAVLKGIRQMENLDFCNERVNNDSNKYKIGNKFFDHVAVHSRKIEEHINREECVLPRSSEHTAQ